jgi:hypothetical protein
VRRADEEKAARVRALANDIVSRHRQLLLVAWEDLSGSELRGERALEADLVTLEGFWYRKGMEARRRIRELEGSRGA